MDTKQLIVIAELAQGCEGDFNLAKTLISAAAKANADIVKFQMVYADELATPDYQYYELFTQLEFTTGQWAELVQHANAREVRLAMDVFGYKSLQVCEETGVNIIKLHPTDTTNFALLRAINQSAISDVILGVGGAYFDEIKNAIKVLGRQKRITLLHGFQGYPTPLAANNLSRLSVLRRELSEYENLAFGFADHEVADSEFSDTLPAMSIGFGASVIEKHFTLTRNMELEDSESALNADEFLAFANNMKTLYTAIGEKNSEQNFGMSKEEGAYRTMIRRHVLLKHDMEAGSILSDGDVVLKRSASKEPIYTIEEVVGKRLKFNLLAESALENKHLENG